MTNYEAAIKELESKLGKGAVMSFEDSQPDVEMFSSGSMYLNNILGGGYPEGRIIEIYGPESSGKSTLCIHAAVETQKLGKQVIYIDTEQAFDPTYGKNLGLNYSKDLWLISQPDSGEDTFTIVEAFLKVKNVGLIVVDSVATMTPRAEIDGDMGDSKMGLHARLMGQGLRKIVSLVNKSNVTVLFINQVRDKIGIVYGNPETTTGGNALKFYASQRLRISIAGKNKLKDGSIGSVNAKIKIVKNKVAPPFKEALITIAFGKGIDKLKEIIDIAVELDIIHKAGSWFSYDETKLGQGENSVKEILLDNPELLEEIKQKITPLWK